MHLTKTERVSFPELVTADEGAIVGSTGKRSIDIRVVLKIIKFKSEVR
jgi:hypothetical protein